MLWKRIPFWEAKIEQFMLVIPYYQRLGMENENNISRPLLHKFMLSTIPKLRY